MRGFFLENALKSLNFYYLTQTDPSLTAGEDEGGDVTDVTSQNINNVANDVIEAANSQDSLAVSPSNLLVTFLEHCSIVMQDVKSESSQNTVKLRYCATHCSNRGLRIQKKLQEKSETAMRKAS